MAAQDILKFVPRRLLITFIALASVSSAKISGRLLLHLLFKLPWYLLRGLIREAYPQMLTKNISKDVVMITGAASGIGRLLAMRFARKCEKIILLDVNADALTKVSKEIAALDGCRAKVFEVTANLADRESTYKAMESTKQQAGDVTMLINNAGVVTGKNILDATDQQIDLTMQVNTICHFWTLKSVLPAMLSANKGHVVTISSNAGLCGVPGLVDYCASKFGALGLNESLRLELKKRNKSGVKTTVICPFFIKTGMFEGAQSKLPLLCPILEPDYAADQIMRAILVDQELLIMPRFSYLARLVQALLPVQSQDDVMEILGFSDGMDEFKGRSGKK